MTEKGDILAYLVEVQRMQLQATKASITLAYWPDMCAFRVILEAPRQGIEKGGGSFTIWRDISAEYNQREMERLREVYNKCEHDTKTTNEQ